MMNKFFKIFLPIIIFIFFFALVVGAYWWNFGTRPISDNPENWGQFGDYIGGLLNPLIGLVNLGVIIYFGYYGFIKDKEFQKKQIMPLVHIEFEQSYNETTGKLESMGIFIKNCGFGPMIVTSISIIGANNQVYVNYNEILEKFPQSVRAWTYHNGEEGIIDKGEIRYLMEIKSTDGQYIMKEGFDLIKQFGLKIIYKDIFEEEHVIQKSSKTLFDGATYYYTP